MTELSRDAERLQRPRQRDKSSDINLFRPPRRIDASARVSMAGSTPSPFRLWRNILRRCPNAACVTRANNFRLQGSGDGFGTTSTTDETTFGGGVKADGGTSNNIRALVRQPQSTPSRP